MTQTASSTGMEVGQILANFHHSYSIPVLGKSDFNQTLENSQPWS